MVEQLNILVDKLSDELEIKPDKWLNSPQGWLYKPSFTRPEQDRDPEKAVPALSTPAKKAMFSDFGKMVKGTMSSTYKKRWFTLSTEKRCLIYYKDDAPDQMESGFIDISQIIDVQRSVMADAPPHSIDLVSAEKYFTVAAETEAQMVLWAYAINSCRPQNINLNRSFDNSEGKDHMTADIPVGEKWTRFDYTYNVEGPLMLNVMGTTNKDRRTGKVINNWIIVTSFESTPDGKPGRSEATGVISVKDYVVAINGTDLLKFTFNESMAIINKASYPKTVSFLRDNSLDRQQSRAEGWAVVFYPSLNRKRRRYVDIRWDSINFRKPAPGGSANSQRDAFVSLMTIDSIKPIIDKSMLSDQQYILRLFFKPGSRIDHVGDDDHSLGYSSLEYLDLCFAKETQMKNWRSVLVSPSIYSSFESTSAIHVQDLELLEATHHDQPKANSNMAIKSELTGFFAPREFHITDGNLHWVRVGQKQQTGRLRRTELVTATSCKLQSVRAVEVSKPREVYKYQLLLELKAQTPITTITMGMKDKATLLKWLGIVRELVATAPSGESAGVHVSDDIEKEVAAQGDDDDEDLVNNVRSTGLEGAKNGLQGYLYKKSNRMLNTQSTMFRRRWFVLHDHMLYWYKNSIEVQAGFPPQGIIDLSTAYEVRESIDQDAPENAIDVVTNAKTMTIAAVDETDYNLWLDALSDTLEIREMAIQRDAFNGGSKADKAERGLTKEQRKAERIAAIRSSIIYSGHLLIKSGKESIFKAAWKDRYFVIASGALTYYSDQNDMFDENKDFKGEIAIANILVVETSHDTKYRSGSVFDVHARVLEGGNADGMRVFTFDAKNPEIAERWMRELCKATEILELRSTAKDGFASHVSDKMVQARNNKRMPSNMPSNAVNVAGGANLSVSTARTTPEGEDDVGSTVDSSDDLGSPVTRPSRSESFEASHGMPSAGRSSSKKNGMGRGNFIKQGGRAVAAPYRNLSTPDQNDLMHGESYGDLYGDGVL